MTDNELIIRIKENADSVATLELINRHSGVYIDVISQYSFSPKVQMPELKDDRAYNIYSWALKFDPAREVKFDTYVGRMTEYMCLNLMNRTNESVELEDSTPNTDMDTQGSADRHTDIAEINDEVEKVNDKLFWEIFKLRFDGKRPRSWRQIGRRVRLSHEGARKHFIKCIGSVKEQLAT